MKKRFYKNVLAYLAQLALNTGWSTTWLFQFEPKLNLKLFFYACILHSNWNRYKIFDIYCSNSYSCSISVTSHLITEVKVEVVKSKTIQVSISSSLKNRVVYLNYIIPDHL